MIVLKSRCHVGRYQRTSDELREIIVLQMRGDMYLRIRTFIGLCMQTFCGSVMTVRVIQRIEDLNLHTGSTCGVPDIIVRQLEPVTLSRLRKLPENSAANRYDTYEATY